MQYSCVLRLAGWKGIRVVQWWSQLAVYLQIKADCMIQQSQIV